jgi:hypothetical protein
MPLSLPEFEEGVREYWREIASRHCHVQAREEAFDKLAAAYSVKNPPHFNRAELRRIMEWKHTDVRWFNRAMEGINAASDARILQVTSNIPSEPPLAVQQFNGAFHGVGVASVSAILTAARPDLYAVIDVFALIAIDRYYTFSWIDRMARNKDGQLQPTYSDYPSYVECCRVRARELSKGSGQEWTARRVDMALWGVGKKLSANKRVACR